MSSHLRRGLFPVGFSSITMRMSGFWLRQACSVHCNILFFTVSRILGLWKSVSSSLFFLILHSSLNLFFIGPKMFRKIFHIYKLHHYLIMIFNLSKTILVCIQNASVENNLPVWKIFTPRNFFFSIEMLEII